MNSIHPRRERYVVLFVSFWRSIAISPDDRASEEGQLVAMEGVFAEERSETTQSQSHGTKKKLKAAEKALKQTEQSPLKQE